MRVVTLSGLRRPLGADATLYVDRLTLDRGERLVVFGPNGAGKSTLLRTLAGTAAVRGGGRVEVAPSSYLPQRPYLFRGTAGWNLTLGLPPEAEARATELAWRFGVGRLLGRAARSLSGGERQRVALARVLARPESLVLLDEPLAPFDARDRMQAARQIVGAIGSRAAVVVTHDHDEAAVLGDRMAVLLEGRVIQTGSIEEVFTMPADDRVAGVVGLGNVLDGDVTAVDGSLVSTRVGPIEVWGVGEVGSGDHVRVLFGAEAVTLYAGDAPAGGSARNVWSGRIAEVRPAGRLVEVLVDVGPTVAALITPGSLEALEVQPGRGVTLAVKATAVRVVPA